MLRFNLFNLLATLGMFGSFIDDPNKPGGTQEPTPGSNGGDEKTVNISQEKLDKLISEGYGKGASKAESKLLEQYGLSSMDELGSIITSKKELDDANKTELQKLADKVSLLEQTNTTLTSEKDGLQNQLQLNTLASENNIKDTGYFKYLYDAAKKEEGFEESKFIEDLKTSNPTMFGEIEKKVKDLPNPANGNGNPKSEITREELQNKTPKERKEFFKNGGTIRD